MPTGACGINCDVCKLNVMGICSSCGDGTSFEAIKKISAQKKLFGMACPLLECAKMNKHNYCLRDCQSFPCENFKNMSYPFSQGYLAMQERRRKEKVPNLFDSDILKVPDKYWNIVKKRDFDELCTCACVKAYPHNRLILSNLQEELQVDLQHNCIKKFYNGSWKKINHPLLEIITLLYLGNVKADDILNEMISVNEFKNAFFFKGPNKLKIEPLVLQYGSDPISFKMVAEALGGKLLDIGDASYKFLPFPKIPLYYIFWFKDEEFEANLTVFFDKSIELHLSPEAIWGIVNFVSDSLMLL